MEEALELHAPDPEDPLGVLAQIGGLEHAAIVGVILAGAVYGLPVILDGVVSNSAALVARALAPHSAGYVIAGHRSAEPGARIVLEYLELEPLLDLDMRLGEGTGGLLAVPLVQAAARTLAEMATLRRAGRWLNLLNRGAIESLQSPLARVVEVHGALGSTQERARELAHAGTPHGTLVVAEIQTGGRGRLGRHWGSPKGGLWMSLVLRPRFAASLASRITQTAAVGVAKALWEVGVEVRIKWPNDLLAGGKKICGILAESSAGNAGETVEERRLDYVILGVGMNANLDPAELGVQNREVTTIRSELGRDVDLLELLRACALEPRRSSWVGSRTSEPFSKTGET